MEKDYSNRELDTKFSSIIEFLTDIKTQTTKTNGRVNKLERNILIIACILGTVVLLKFPEVLSVVKIFI